MTVAEKIEMFKNKQNFVDTISSAFQNNPKGTSVESISYEVYQKELENLGTYFCEWIVVHFVGGAISVRSVNGNSNHANFRAIGQLIDGGYYDEVPDFITSTERGFERVVL